MLTTTNIANERPRNVVVDTEIRHFELLLFSYDMVRLKAFEKVARPHEAKDTDTFKLYAFYPLLISTGTSQLVIQAFKRSSDLSTIKPIDIIVDDSQPDQTHLEWKGRKIVNYFKRRDIYHIILNLLDPIKEVDESAYAELNALARNISHHGNFCMNPRDPNPFLDVVRVDAIY
ncbi:hypothetical protein ABXZ88_003908 [Vibrio fluvialis]